MPCCPSCGQDVRDDARHCAACGASLERQCPRCASAVGPAQKFCGECGADLRAAPVTEAPAPVSYTPPHLAARILDSRHALRGERKLVTVLFCDIAGSTSLAAELGAEATHALLSAFFRVALDEVHRYEGTLNQFLGDGFMAIFGAPLAHEDHAVRACCAALGIRAAIAARPEPMPAGWDRLRLRMGLNSGQVVVGAIGDDLRMDYTASGDTTHLAARLEALAGPGEILCSEATVRAAHGALAVAARTPVLVKGLAQPVQFHTLEGLREHGRMQSFRTRFVGRGVELDALHAALQRAAAGHGGVVAIEGEAGLGKSRLIAEFCAASGESARSVRAQCVAYGRHAPNVPIVELVRALCGLAAQASEAEEAAALDRLLDADAVLLGDPLAALIGGRAAAARLADLDPATLRGRTERALRVALERAARERPLLLVVEDLHWADASSLEFLAALAAVATRHAWLLVVSLRPGRTPGWVLDSGFAPLVLRPLEAEDAQRLVASIGLSGTLPGERVADVLARADGNPFFLEELTRAAAEADDEVPGDVFDVLSARIDRLAPDAKDLLRIAAVIGREFALGLLVDIAGAGARPLAATLVDSGFLERRAEHERYAFVHALTQEVAYDGMLSTDRQRLHSAVAHGLTARNGGDERVSAEIARHHLQGLTPHAALPHLEIANRRAIAGHALEAAYDFFRAALALLEAEEATPANLARRAVLVLEEFTVFHFTHRQAEYRELIERYVPLVETLGEPALHGAYLAQLGHRLWVAGEFANAAGVLRRAARICADAGSAPGAAHAECLLSWSEECLGNAARAVAHGQAALRWLEQCPVPLLETYACVGILRAHVHCGRWAEALEAAQRAREAGLRAGDEGLVSFAGAFASVAALEAGDTTLALELAERAMTEAPTPYFRGWAAAFKAAALARAGEAEAALPILEQVCALARASAHHGGYQYIALFLAEALRRTGRREALRALLAELREATAEYPFARGECHRHSGETLLEEGEPARAAAEFRTAAAIFEEIGAANAANLAAYGLGRAQAALGDTAAARLALLAAQTGFARLGTLGMTDTVAAALVALA